MAPRPPRRRSTAAAPRRPSLSSPDSLRELIQSLREGVYITRANGEILDANPAMLEMLGVRSLAALRGRRIQEWIDPRQRHEEHAILARAGVVRDFEFTFRRPDGELRTVIDTAFVRGDPRDGAPVFCGILIDITERKRLERQLVELGQRDPLTGCFNRRFLPAFEAGAEAQGWACIIIDVDHFKHYNDRHGHERGDRVLVRVARFLAGLCRAEDAVVRLGGDEFMVVLRGLRGSALDRVVRRLTRAARGGSPVPFSVGFATRRAGERLEETMARADRRLIAVRVAERGEQRRGLRTRGRRAGEPSVSSAGSSRSGGG